MSEPKVLIAEELDDLRGPYMHMGIEYRASLWCSYSNRLLATIDAQQKVIDAARICMTVHNVTPAFWQAYRELEQALAALDKEMKG